MHNQSFFSNIFGMFNDCVQLNNVSKCNVKLTSKWMLLTNYYQFLQIHVLFS